MKQLLISLSIITLVATGCGAEQKDAYQTQATQTFDTSTQYSAVIKTSLGDITLTLFTPEAPKTVENFVQLSQSGFYNATKFHRVISDFMIQGGDPNSKDADCTDDGTGGPGYRFVDEINTKKLVRGRIAMANAGPNTNGSQFFIVTKESTPWLDGKHTVFGEVTAGMETVDAIEALETDKTSCPDHPVQDVVIQSIEITPIQ